MFVVQFVRQQVEDLVQGVPNRDVELDTIGLEITDCCTIPY